MTCFVQKTGTDDAGANPVGYPSARLTIAAALADLAANYPAASSSNYHIVGLGPGVYSEVAIALPPWTFIDGTCDAEGQPTTFIQLAEGADITLSAGWSANVTARGGLSNLSVIADAGGSILDFTMPAPAAGNPSRTVELTNVHYNLASMLFEALSTADVFRAAACKQYGAATDSITLQGGTLLIDNFLSAAIVTVNDTGGVAVSGQIYGLYITSATGGIVFASTTAGVVVRMGGCDNRNLTLNKGGAGTLAISADAISIPLVANVFYLGTATTANLIRTTDSGGVGPGVLPTDYATANNATGNSTVTTTASVFSYLLTMTVNDGRTSVAILAIPGTISAGARISLDISAPGLSTPILEIRNATAGGTLLDTFQTSDGTTYFGQFVYNGAAWVRQAGQIPA